MCPLACSWWRVSDGWLGLFDPFAFDDPVRHARLESVGSDFASSNSIPSGGLVPPANDQRASIATRERASIATRERASVATRERASVATRERASVATRERASVATRERASIATRERASVATRERAAIATRERARPTSERSACFDCHP